MHVYAPYYLTDVHSLLFFGLSSLLNTVASLISTSIYEIYYD
jgi:hypothetical protein